MGLACPGNSKKDRQYAAFEVNHKCKVDNSLAKVCEKVDRVWTTTQSNGLPLPEAYEFRCRGVHCWWENEEFFSPFLFS